VLVDADFSLFCQIVSQECLLCFRKPFLYELLEKYENDEASAEANLCQVFHPTQIIKFTLFFFLMFNIKIINCDSGKVTSLSFDTCSVYYHML